MWFRCIVTYMKWLWTGFGLIIRFTAFFDTAHCSYGHYCPQSQSSSASCICRSSSSYFQNCPPSLCPSTNTTHNSRTTTVLFIDRLPVIAAAPLIAQAQTAQRILKGTGRTLLLCGPPENTFSLWSSTGSYLTTTAVYWLQRRIGCSVNDVIACSPVVMQQRVSADFPARDLRKYTPLVGNKQNIYFIYCRKDVRSSSVHDVDLHMIFIQFTALCFQQVLIFIRK